MRGHQGPTVSRRALLRAGVVGFGALVAGCSPERRSTMPNAPGFGPLVPDPGGVIDLPRGFQYRILSEDGGTLSSGAPVPGDPDGMAAFPGPGGTTILVRNHELVPGEGPPAEGANPFSDGPGGTTAIVVGPDRREIESYVTSSGTVKNCAGGRTPWGTWLTCEETRDEGHGFVFEVMPKDPENDLSKTPIVDMGYFAHEAAAVDPSSGIVYLTEDESPNSFLFRYLPDDPGGAPGALQRGGRLEVLGIVSDGDIEDDSLEPRQSWRESWIEVGPDQAREDAEASGAVHFRRLEGACFAAGTLWFNDTEGGELGLGQTFRYFPQRQRLELFFESTDGSHMKSPDNNVITPWGDYCFVEDAPEGNRIVGVTPAGETYELGANLATNSELAGPCFSPDGKTLFVNIQESGMTLAIWGPFPEPNAARVRRMARAAPPPSFAPALSSELGEASARHGLTQLQAAAFDRVGVPLLG